MFGINGFYSWQRHSQHQLLIWFMILIKKALGCEQLTRLRARADIHKIDYLLLSIKAGDWRYRNSSTIFGSKIKQKISNTSVNLSTRKRRVHHANNAGDWLKINRLKFFTLTSRTYIVEELQKKKTTRFPFLGGEGCTCKWFISSQ